MRAEGDEYNKRRETRKTLDKVGKGENKKR